MKSLGISIRNLNAYFVKKKLFYKFYMLTRNSFFLQRFIRSQFRQHTTYNWAKQTKICKQIKLCSYNVSCKFSTIDWRCIILYLNESSIRTWRSRIIRQAVKRTNRHLLYVDAMITDWNFRIQSSSGDT